jgi:hypothetical protein
MKNATGQRQEGEVMYGPSELKSLVQQRHEGALQAARTQRLARQALVNRSPRLGWASANLPWASVLSVLRGVGLS